MGEPKGEYVVTDQTAVMEELLRLFTAEQLAQICAEFRAIAETGYGSLTIQVESGWVHLLPTPSRRIGRLKKSQEGV